MRLQEEATELEKTVVSLIEQTKTEPTKQNIKEHLLREYRYLTLVKESFPELRFPQYEQIKNYMQQNDME